MHQEGRGIRRINPPLPRLGSTGPHRRWGGVKPVSYTHLLNNTCVAPPRMLIALLENNLQADGSVKIPKVLQPYMGGKEVLVPKQ